MIKEKIYVKQRNLLVLGNVLIILFLSILLFEKGDLKILLAMMIPFALLTVWLYRLSLNIEIDSDKITYWIRGLTQKRTLDWKHTSRVRVMKYKPWQFGGVGYRITSKYKAFVMGGNIGLEIDRGENKKLLLEISNQEEIEKFISTLNQSLAN